MSARSGALLLPLVFAACSGTEELCTQQVQVIDNHKWTLIEASRDPFSTDTSTTYQCNDVSMGPEELGAEPSFTIVTFVCRWATVEQPLLLDLQKGEPLNLRIFYFSQTTFDPASADVIVAIGDQRVHSSSVALPATADLIAPVITMPVDAPKGTMVRFHLSNHGQNSWNFIELSAKRPADCSAVDGGGH